ncbi:hypothetical protein ACFYMW_01590 [Streptomyces sp. NPDC006692]|uniref:hypothetical protein n=1 Tax=unclassified Streptomyces TaxID=2593676 RepID=UPI0036B99FEF
MAPGLRPLTAAATLTGALLLTPLPYASAVSTPSPGPPATATPSRSPNSSPSTRTYPPSAWPSSPTASASAEQHLAGSRAGEGRTRPGRVSPPHDFLPYAADDELQLPDAVKPAQQEDAPQTQTQPQTQTPVPKPPEPRESAPPPAPSTAPQHPPSATHHHPSAQAVTDESDLRYHVLSLGAGLALTGLGLGFLGLRLRRP